MFRDFSPDGVYHAFYLFPQSAPALAGVSFGSEEKVHPNDANRPQLTKRKSIIAWSLS